MFPAELTALPKLGTWESEGLLEAMGYVWGSMNLKVGAAEMTGYLC